MGWRAEMRVCTPTSVCRIPSPLNGEKVAEGRMRGGHTHNSGLCDKAILHQLTLPPLTLSPSPR
jgi:hypothetical protein